MSRSRLPPTPAMSGEFIVKDNASVDASDPFALPPAAISPSKMQAASRRPSKTDPSASFPASPASPDLALGIMANSPRQTGVKRPLEDFNLPPPPTRTRKIIQMKPKTQSPPKPTAPASKASSKDNGKTPANNGASANSKKKQPSATSAAGRKIARKTAHSLIERRRRSKMNEEFGTLKDMIPACKGQDMHKLAILQASIDYVNYLEQCILDLKTAGNRHAMASPRMPPAPPSPTSPEALAEESGLSSASVSPELPPADAAADAISPAFSPRSGGPIGTAPDFASSITPSPALGPTHPSDNPLRSERGSWAVSSSSTSPVMQSRYSIASSADVDHEASAALLMLNRDCRGSVGSVHDVPTNSLTRHGNPHTQDPQRKIGMSVKDLLIS
ncbi:transcriptional regulator family: Helix-loop-helix [Aspergillus niger]|nr:transcriptional regulator family: Helix-loop-helix [Aspergillus niger]KAI3084500.1 transcriptional regulator family: Helix-loop-helix [Aspergillus niger]